MPTDSSSNLNEHSPNDDLVRYCDSAPPHQIISNAPYGDTVCRISPMIAIKFGPGITETEANNQSRAFDLLDPKIGRVPKMYRFFKDSLGRGFIVMEYIDGKIIDPLSDPTHIDRIVAVINHMTSITREKPGPVDGGVCQGLLFWPEDGLDAFRDIHDLQDWWSKRLFPGNPRLNLLDLQPVLCHLDIAPRNIVWDDSDIPTLLDWGSAGFYPRVFEYCSQQLAMGKEGSFTEQLLDAMDDLSPNEQEQMKSILKAWSNMQRYSFVRFDPPDPALLESIHQPAPPSFPT